MQNRTSGLRHMDPTREKKYSMNYCTTTCKYLKMICGSKKWYSIIQGEGEKVKEGEIKQQSKCPTGCYRVHCKIIVNTQPMQTHFLVSNGKCTPEQKSRKFTVHNNTWVPAKSSQELANKGKRPHCLASGALFYSKYTHIKIHLFTNLNHSCAEASTSNEAFVLTLFGLHFDISLQKNIVF